MGSQASLWGEPDSVRWQWLHKTGHKDYSEVESNRIERFFWEGAWMMRLKSGQGRHARPREIYFYDMVQYDPKSGNTRDVRRFPEETRFLRYLRTFYVWWYAIAHGEKEWWKPISKAELERRRRNYDEDEETGEDKAVFNNSCWTRVKDTCIFSIIINIAILWQSLWLWYDADHNDGTTVTNTAWEFIIMNNVFCFTFTAEIIIRFCAYRKKRYCLQDGWFVFDSVLVAFMIFETWILVIVVKGLAWMPESQMKDFTVFRSLRLLRITLLTRLFKVVPQLMVLLKGITQAMSSLLYSGLLWVALTYVFAIIFKNIAEGEEDLRTEFGLTSVKNAMFTLLIYGTFMDSVGDMIRFLRAENGYYAGIFLIYAFLANLTMLNMLIGILCEVVGRVQALGKENAARQELEMSLLDILEVYDVNEDQILRRLEFKSILDNPDMQMILATHQIDANDLRKLEDVLFDDDEEDAEGNKILDPSISWHHFLEKVFQLRGGNTATVTDVVELRGYIRKRLKGLEEKLMPEKRPSVCLSDQQAKTLLSGASATAPPNVELTCAAAAAQATATLCDPPLQAEEASTELCREGADFTPFQDAMLCELRAVRESREALLCVVHELRERVSELEGWSPSAARRRGLAQPRPNSSFGGRSEALKFMGLLPGTLPMADSRTQ